MIGYEMGSSPAGVYMNVNMATMFVKGVFLRSSFLGIL
jgi:hypothetical protein